MTSKIISQCAICILATLTGLHAITWKSATDGAWNASANWTDGAVPTASDEAKINKAAIVTISAAADANNLVTGNNSTLTISSGGSLTVETDADVGNSGENAYGTAVVDGGILTIREQLILAKFGSTRTGTIQLNSGNITVGENTGVMTNPDDDDGDGQPDDPTLKYNDRVVQIAGNNSGSIGIVNIAGGTFTAYGKFTVGAAGDGTLTLSGGILDLSVGNWQPLEVGVISQTGVGTVNMTGGTLVTYGLLMGKTGATDNAKFNLDGGILDVTGAFSAAIKLKENSELAIGDGVFQWKGDTRNAIGALITSGNITFATTTVSDDYSGITPEQSWTSPDETTTLYADYDEVRNGYTTVWASSNDTDGDGLIDLFETNTGTFVSASDTGTDPNDPDTDDDGLDDGVETNTGTFVSATNTGTNPLVADTDSDGLDDGVETNTGTFVSATNTGTNPLLSDTDGDTISDGVETGLDPTSNSQAAIDLLPSAGYTEQQLIDLRVGSKLASIANEQATLQVVIEQSNDLGSWSTIKTEDVTVAAPAGTDKQFFRYRMQD